MDKRIEKFAKLLEKEQLKNFYRKGWTHEPVLGVRIIPGRKYIKVNVGASGKYMIDGDKIFGIKGYGVIHKGHQYGTLDTIEDWYWGSYKAHKKEDNN